MSGTDVRALRDWLRLRRGVVWSPRKCARVLAQVEIELARHRVMARRETIRQAELDEQPADDATIEQGFAELRRMIAEGQP